MIIALGLVPEKKLKNKLNLEDEVINMHLDMQVC